jgi:hypothetical protein
MANTDARNGLRPYKGLHDQPVSGGLRRFSIPSGYATALFVGDPVVINGDGNTTYPHYQYVERAAAAGPITGVIVSFEPDRDNLTQIHSPASTLTDCYVQTDPNQIYTIQDDGAGTPSDAWQGLNADLVYTHAGSTTTGRSGAELDGSSVNTTSTLALQILGPVPTPGNDPTADYCIWMVRINDSSFNSVVAGI